MPGTADTGIVLPRHFQAGECTSDRWELQVRVPPYLPWWLYGLSCCVTSGRSCPLSGLQLPHLV